MPDRRIFYRLILEVEQSLRHIEKSFFHAVHRKVFPYGFGIHRLTNRDSADIIFPDRLMAGHPGIAYGLLSDMYFDRDTKSGIVFITNGSKKDFTYGAKTTFKILLRHTLVYLKLIYPVLCLIIAPT